MKARFFALLAICVIFAGSALACPVCYTDPESPTSNALAYAIIVLLGITGSVLGGFVGLFLYLRNRARKLTLNGTTDFPGVN
jgi:hypothetical protein